MCVKENDRQQLPPEKNENCYNCDFLIDGIGCKKHPTHNCGDMILGCGEWNAITVSSQQPVEPEAVGDYFEAMAWLVFSRVHDGPNGPYLDEKSAIEVIQQIHAHGAHASVVRSMSDVAMLIVGREMEAGKKQIGKFIENKIGGKMKNESAFPDEKWNENVETCSGCGIEWKKIGKQCPVCYAPAEKHIESAREKSEVKDGK